jgi:hypothetical protein
MKKKMMSLFNRYIYKKFYYEYEAYPSKYHITLNEEKWVVGVGEKRKYKTFY